MRLRALDMTLKRGVLNVLTILFLFGCQGEQEMTFNIPKDLALVSTTVTDSTPAHSATTLYLEEDEVQYSGGVYIMPLEKNNDVPDFDSAEPYARGDYVVYSGVASALERNVSQAINVPLTASASYSGISLEELIDPNNPIVSVDNGVLLERLTEHFVISDGVLYQHGGTGGWIIAYDISDPANVTEISRIQNADFGWTDTMAVQSNTLFAVSGSGTIGTDGYIWAIDISNPASMSTLSTFHAASFVGPKDMKIYGGNAFICITSGKLVALDITDPTAITFTGSITGTAMLAPYSLVISGTNAYVTAVSSDSLTIIDISTPATMVELGYVVDAVNLNIADGITVVGTTAYVGWLGGVTSIDVSTPATPTVLDTVSTASKTIIEVSNYGGAVYALNSTDNTILVIDITTPSAMKLIGTYDAGVLYSKRWFQYNDSLYIPTYNLTGSGGKYPEPYSIYAAVSKITLPSYPLGNTYSLYNFYTTKYSTHMDITVTRISDSVVIATGEFYYEDSASHISRYYGTGCTTGCGANRLVWIGDDKVYVFTASYTHTNGAIAADFRDTYLAPYGFTYVRPTRPSLPFDTKQYTSVIETGNQTWVVKSLTAFDGVALGRVRGDTISITFKDSLGATVGTPVVDQTINNIIDTSLPDAYTTEIFYAGSVIEANGTVEITIKGTETEIGKIFPTASYVVGSTNLQFSHEIVDFSKEQVSAISGAVDRIEGNKVIDYKGSYDIEMVDYDKAVMLQKYMTGRLVAIDGSDMINNEVADGQGRFASTKIICRIRRLSMKSTVKDDDIAVTTPISFEFREIV